MKKEDVKEHDAFLKEEKAKAKQAEKERKKNKHKHIVSPGLS